MIQLGKQFAMASYSAIRTAIQKSLLSSLKVQLSSYDTSRIRCLFALFAVKLLLACPTNVVSALVEPLGLFTSR